MKLRRLIPLHEVPGMPEAIAKVVTDAAGHVCEVCGLELVGHAPESRWLGFERHDWTPTPADAAALKRARELTTAAYAARSGRASTYDDLA